MKYLDATFSTPAENLACDEALLDWREEHDGEEILRFWESPGPFVVVGYANKIEEEVNVVHCESANVPILRRCSGGGTVLQGRGCLNYALILRISGNPSLANISSANKYIMERNRAAVQEVAGASRIIKVQGHTDLACAVMHESSTHEKSAEDSRPDGYPSPRPSSASAWLRPDRPAGRGGTRLRGSAALPGGVHGADVRQILEVEAFYEPERDSRPKDSPSPRPSPAGRGGIVVRWFETTNDNPGSWFQCIRKKRKESFHELIAQSLVPRLEISRPHPGPLPRGEGELSPDGLKRRTIIPVHGPNACEKNRMGASHEPGVEKFRATLPHSYPLPLGEGTAYKRQLRMESHQAADREVDAVAESGVTAAALQDASEGGQTRTGGTPVPLFKKFSGNSQRRHKTFLLFHGTFLLDFNLALVGEFLKFPSRQPDYRGSRSHAEFLTNLNVPTAAVKAAMIKTWNAEQLLQDAPLDRISTLAREKYARPEWNLRR